MSSFPYINPTSKNQLSVPYSVPQGYTNGTHFSIYGVGGYMEVHNLSDLYLSAGTIPINVQYDLSGNVTTLILNNDNVSSGRRKLGMLAYVYETNSIYQFYIPNYDTAFNTATGSSSYQKRYTIFGTYETYVYPNSATTLLISGWTGNTIEGVNGATSSNASWRKLSFSGGTSSGGTLSGNYLPLSGGTVTGNTVFTLGLTGTTISATTYLNSFQYFISGSTPGGIIKDGDRWFNTTTGAELVYVDDGNSTQWVEPNPGNIFDIYVTGGTYSNGVAVFTNNSGSTFSVTGFTTPFTGNTSATCINSIYVTNVYGCSPINFKDLIIAESGLTTSILTATTITNSYLDTSYVRDSSGTVAIDTSNRQLKKSDGSTIILDWENGILSGMTSIRANTISASTYQNLTTSLNGIYLPLSGGTVTGSTIFTNGLTANTISATTYQNLPTDVRTTGATYSNNTFTFTNNTGGTYSVLFNTLTGLTVNGSLTITGNTSAQGLTATTISATTYQNIPSQSGTGVSSISYTESTGLFSLITNEGRTLSTGTFLYLTGATYSNNTFTYTNNTGGTFNVLFNTVTGLTINGGLTITGNTSAQGLTATTISAATYQNLPTDVRVTGATYSNNNFTFTNNTGGTFNVLFNTLTGLTVNGNITTTGTTNFGNGTFTKAGFATGDIILDNSSTDTPGVLFYYANNSNYGIDSWNGSFDVLSGQLVRITNKLNETGGAVKMAIDTTGNVVFTGFIKANAWRAGQVINDIMLSNTEVTVSTTTIATSNSDTDFVTYSYTPLSSTSYLVIHYHLASFSFEGGTGNDSYFSRIKVDGSEITYSRQSTVNGNRTGVLFPLTGRYTNSNTTAKSIVVACRRDSADDSITIVNSSSSMWLRITEIAR
jgi:hypothetical protein